MSSLHGYKSNKKCAKRKVKAQVISCASSENRWMVNGVCLALVEVRIVLSVFTSVSPE